MLYIIAVMWAWTWNSLAIAQSAVPEPDLLQKSLSLVGFIRMGSDDQQSLVVLKAKVGGRTMILKPKDQIPGTAFHIVRLKRDELVVRGPEGEEIIPLETGAPTEMVSAAPMIMQDSLLIESSQDAVGGETQIVSSRPHLEETKVKTYPLLPRAGEEMPCIDESCGQVKEEVKEKEIILEPRSE